MVGWFELMGEQTDPRAVGKVRLNTVQETRKKPVWIVLVKSLGLASMMAVGYALIVPWMPLPLWQSIVLASGIMLLYIGLAFFVRPEANGDNMGWLGGMMNDPFHISDNFNRGLWNMHCVLGPGRFAAETILDCCTLLGLTAEISAEEIDAELAEQRLEAEAKEVETWRREAMERVGRRASARPSGQVELASTRLLDPDRFGD